MIRLTSDHGDVSRASADMLERVELLLLDNVLVLDKAI